MDAGRAYPHPTHVTCFDHVRVQIDLTEPESFSCCIPKANLYPRPFARGLHLVLKLAFLDCAFMMITTGG